MEENQNLKKGKKYLVIGVLVLFLSVLGVSVSYYLARVQGTLTGRAAGTELTLTITKLSTSATADLIPLDNDLETLNLASLGYGNNSEEFDATKACLDINGYSVCQIYKVRVTNNGTIPLVVNGTVTLSGQNVPNIDCAKMDDEVTVTNNASCKGGNVLANAVTLAANSYNDYYIMVYINNLDEPQYDSGEFNGTVTFTTEDGRKVKGRFTKPFNLAQYITNLYTNANKTTQANNSITYNYATSVNLMNDRLGDSEVGINAGNIRYYGASPNNWIDIGDKTEVAVNNWEALFDMYGMPAPFNDSDGCDEFATQSELTDEAIVEMCAVAGCNATTVDEFCSVAPAGTPILWRIIGVFDGKVRVIKPTIIGMYSYDSSASNVNGGSGINEWSQADLMKLLNPGYETNTDQKCAYNSNTSQIECEQEDGLVSNSLWWNSGSGYCYNAESNEVTECNFTNSGLSDEAKEYVIDQTLYLGGFSELDVYADEAYALERSTATPFVPGYNDCPFSSCTDTVARTTRWTGKVGLPYPSDFGYASDLSMCTTTLNNGCTDYNWMNTTGSFTVNRIFEYTPDGPTSGGGYNETPYYTPGIVTINNGTIDMIGTASAYGGVWPTLLLDSSALAESGNGSQATPYVLVS